MEHSLKEGKISTTSWAANTGEFKRQASSFRSIIPSEKFPAAKGRYHLYVSLACPWAHRTMIVRALKGLQEVIGLSIVHHILGPDGWEFSSTEPGCIPDTVNGFQLIKQLYQKSDPDYNKRFTVPVLWDKLNHTIVNNESSEIIRMFNSGFNEFATNPSLDLYPSSLSKEIDQVNEIIYDGLNNGVYKAGFATKQEPYETNCKLVFKTLDYTEDRLDKSEFLVGNVLTEADIRLFTTTVRFDPVYVGHFKCNLKTIESGYPNILKWMKKIYALPGVKDTVNMDHIKRHYYKSHIGINPTQIVPLSDGPNLE